jgi:hypothetical protein
MTEWNNTPEGRRFYLETLLRQRSAWGGSLAHGADPAQLERRMRKIDELKGELNVTDEAAFLSLQEQAR